MRPFRDLFVVIFIAIFAFFAFQGISIVSKCAEILLSNAAATNPILIPPPKEEFDKLFSSSPATTLLPSHTVFDKSANKFNFGRFHHVDEKEFLNTNFDVPDEAFLDADVVAREENITFVEKTAAQFKKMLTLKEWSWVALTDGEEWFCGTALSHVQTASSFFVYCYNAKSGQSFHANQQSVEWHLLGGFGTQKKNKNVFSETDNSVNDQANVKLSPYANNGCLEWDYGRMSNEQVAYGSQCFFVPPSSSSNQDDNDNDRTVSKPTYQVKTRMIGVEILRKSQDQRVAEMEQPDKRKKSNKQSADPILIDDLEEGPPVEIELSFSFEPVRNKNIKNNDDHPEQPMTVVYPMGDVTNKKHRNRVGLTTKLSAAKAVVQRLRIRRMTSFERGERGEKERTIVDISDEDNRISSNNKPFVALLDWTRAMFPRHTVWRWVAFATIVKSKNVNFVTTTASDEDAKPGLQKVNVVSSSSAMKEDIPTRIGMQLTGLSYLTPGNFSAESSVWINGTIFEIDAKVEIVEEVTTLFKPLKSTMWNTLGKSYTVSFDATPNAKNRNDNLLIHEDDFFKLEMKFIRRGAHVQDFSEYAPLFGGHLDHQFGDFTGELTHFKRAVKKENYSSSGLRLHHVYRFANVPGILEDHDTVW